jgi:hypothetical protein
METTKSMMRKARSLNISLLRLQPPAPHKAKEKWHDCEQVAGLLWWYVPKLARRILARLQSGMKPI